MKKYIIIAIAAIFSISTAGYATAASCNGVAAWAEASSGCTIGSTVTLEIKSSKSVYMAYIGDSTSGRTYSIGSYHSQGNKQFASSSGDQKIFYITYDGATAGDIPGAPSGIGGATWTAGWSAL